MRERLESFDGLAVVCRHDAPTDAWIFIALHDDRLGPMSGGTRMRVYPRPEDGLEDAMRLARGMTYKWGALELPMGGGKAVLAASRPLEGAEREGLLRRYGRLVQSLGGGFSTGEDLGTTTADMAVIGEMTRYVHLHPDEAGQPLDPGPYTARGVLSGVRATVAAVTGSPSVDGLTVLVQGIGNVGGPLARALAEAGARVLVSDVDGERAAAFAAEAGASVVPPEEACEVECDVFAPCAIGGVLSAATIPRLACRMVAGSANNQLLEDADAERLHERGILYAPDYIINGGGALAFGLLGLRRCAKEDLMAQMERVGERLSRVFAEAAERGESPAATADRQVERVLAAGLD